MLELRILIGTDVELNYKRECWKTEFEEIYFGLGNYAIMSEELHDELDKYDEECLFGLELLG